MSGNTIELGLAATVLALGSACLAVTLAIAALHLTRPAFMAAARQAMYLNFFLITLACLAIVWSFVELDFTVLYVVQNANRDLPMIYRLSALWGAHEGSLMLWLWFLTGYSALAAFLHRYSHPLSMPYVVVTLGLIQIGFLTFILFLSSPFTRIFPAAAVGRELNPLLQDPGLIFHPPMLYLGYVGFSVPFAFAIAALIRGQAGNEWAVATRRWTLFAWAALTSGILLGGYWAYYELGWGGYWAWDPVENASLMPWLTGTAFLHSIMALERRGLFQSWNVFLIVTTFCLSLLGTFLVRSGVLTSVHAFAVDPERGVYILIFLAAVMLTSFGLLVFRGDRLRTPNRVNTLLSRESAILFNNIFLLTAAGTVFLGTLYPLAAEVVSGDRLTIAAPYFNLVVLPMMIAIIALMAFGPVVPWRKASARFLRRSFSVPALFALGAVGLAAVAGVADLVGLVAVATVGLAFAATLTDAWRAVHTRARTSKTSLASSFGHLLVLNRRRYGGLVVHLGVLVVAIGMIASGTLGQVSTVLMAPGDRFESGRYTVTFSGMESVDGPNYLARQATLAISENGHPVDVLRPQRRSYPRGDMITTEAGIRTTLFEDLYLVLGQEQGDGSAIIRVYNTPLVVWIWIGWLVILVGALLAISQGRREPARDSARDAKPVLGTLPDGYRGGTA